MRVFVVACLSKSQACSWRALRRDALTSLIDTRYSTRTRSFSELKNPPAFRPDATAKKPNKKCDPYGQQGKPLEYSNVQDVIKKMNIHTDWEIEQNKNDSEGPPLALKREFLHANFLDGAKLVHKLAAICVVNATFPSITLDRRIVKKQWQIFTVIRFSTQVLGGLSGQDLHVAMVSTTPDSVQPAGTNLFKHSFCNNLAIFCT
jgi:pterin-4a-carbinolamine dehydratase